MTLREYLLASRRRLDPGAFDCILWLADWIVLAGHPDPAVRHRGRYNTWKAAAKIVKRAGGLEALARAGAEDAGLVEIDPADAVAGDVGIGVMDEAVGPAGLIRAGGFWAALQPGAGLVIGAARMLAAWRV